MNSWYQALAYAYLCNLIDSPGLVPFAKAVIESGSKMMEYNYMDADIISTFCEPLMDLVDAIGSSNPNQRLTRDHLLSAFMEEESKVVAYDLLVAAADVPQRQTVLSHTCDF